MAARSSAVMRGTSIPWVVDEISKAALASVAVLVALIARLVGVITDVFTQWVPSNFNRSPAFKEAIDNAVPFSLSTLEAPRVPETSPATGTPVTEK